MRSRIPSATVVLSLIGSLLALVLALAGCSGGGAAGGATTTASATGPSRPVVATDANGTAITIPAVQPTRIISLAATDSEILSAIGAAAQVIGVDAYTDFPAGMVTKTKYTDSNGIPNVEQIINARPDLVLSFGGETRSWDQQLLQAKVNVVSLPLGNIDGSLNDILLVGQLTHQYPGAATLVDQMRTRINAVRDKVKYAPKVSVYMEVDDSTPGKPYVTGGNTFGDQLIIDAGGTNIFASNSTNGGYPQVGDESIIAANPQVIVLTEDPLYGGDPTKVAGRPGWSAITAVSSHHVYQINSDLIQRPGPRLADGLEQLAKMLHPEIFGPPTAS
jgi:iron complex transport system substrate-binding protein